MGLKFPNLDRETGALYGYQARQRDRTRRHQREPWEEFSFLLNGTDFLEWVYPEIGMLFPQNATAPVASGALLLVLENPREA